MGEITDLGYKLSFSGDQTDQMLDLVNDRTPTPARGSDLPFTAGGAYNLGLLKNTDYYLSPNGDDSNDGLTAATAVRTCNRLNQIIPNNLGGHTAAVVLDNNGVYDYEPIQIQGKVNGRVVVNLNSATIGKLILSQCTDVRAVGNPTIQYLPSQISYSAYEALCTFRGNGKAAINFGNSAQVTGTAESKALHISGIFFSENSSSCILSNSYTYNVIYSNLFRAIAVANGMLTINPTTWGSSGNDVMYHAASGILTLPNRTPQEGEATTMYTVDSGRIYNATQANIPNY